MTFSVRGRVLDEAGQPLAGADVFANKRSTRSAADGTFVFDGLEPHSMIRATLDDWFAPTVTVDTEDSVELRMRKGATLVARVVADGMPLAGAIVAFSATVRATTDDRGVATIRGLPYFGCAAGLSGRVLAPGRASPPWAIEPTSSAVIERTFELEPGAPVQGRVVNHRGEPVRTWVRVNGGAIDELISDDDGRWGFSLAAGRYQIKATDKHGSSASLEIECDGRTAQTDLVLDYVSPPGERVGGVVVDEHGHPVANVKLHITRHGETLPPIWYDTTDEAGRFETPELATGALDIHLRWHKRDSVDQKVIHQARTGDTNLRLLFAGPTIRGRVLLDGAPVSYFGFLLIAAERLPKGAPMLLSVNGVRSSDGRFDIPHVPDGRWCVVVRAPGTRFTVTPAIEVASNGEIDLGDIALERGYAVRGVVRDVNGTPVPRARVVVGRWSSLAEVRGELERLFLGVADATTDDHGAYVLDGLGALPAVLIPEIIQAAHPVAGQSIIQPLPLDETTLDFTLLESGRIAGHSKNSELVYAVRSDEPLMSRSVTATTKGRFEILVPPGDYGIGSPTNPSIRVTVIAGQTVEVTMAE